MEALKIFSDAPYSLEQQKTFAVMAVNEILSGTMNPLHVDLRLKALEETIKKIRENKDVKEYVMDEASKYGKSFTEFGCKVTFSQRTTKDYSNCGDQLYNELSKQMEALKAQIKAREKMLDTGVNIETGEAFNPPLSKSTEFLKVEFL